MSKFSNGFEVPSNIKNEKEKQEFIKMAYNTFCVNFVNELRKNLKYEESFDKNIITFKIDIPPVIERRKEWDKAAKKETKGEVKPPNINFRDKGVKK